MLLGIHPRLSKWKSGVRKIITVTEWRHTHLLRL
jgi:hypothetical protein